MVTAAAFQMARSNKKIALLSFCDNEKKNNIENFAFSFDDLPDADNPLAELGDFEFSDTGIDALVRRSETGILTKEHFNNCSMPAVKAQNGLDIVGTTNAENFEDDMNLRFEIAKRVLTVAEELYDYVFVLADSQHAELAAKLDEVADQIIVVIRQGKPDVSSSCLNELKSKMSLLVADYEAESSFGIRYLKSNYKMKQIFVMPHSVTYRDACANGSLIRFALRNTFLKETSGDINYTFSADMNALLDHVCGKTDTAEEEETEEQSIDEIQPKIKSKKKRRRKMREVPADTVKPETIAEKKKLFKKQETYERIVIGQDHLAPGERVVDENALSRRQEPDDYVLNESPITHGEEDQNGQEPSGETKDVAQDERQSKENAHDSETVDIPGTIDAPVKETDIQPVKESFREDSRVTVETEESPMPEESPAVLSDSTGENMFSDPEKAPSVDISEPASSHDAVSNPDRAPAQTPEPVVKKKKGLFSFLRKNRPKIYEADFNNLQHPGVDAIEEEIADSMRNAEYSETAEEVSEETHSDPLESGKPKISEEEEPSFETEKTSEQETSFVNSFSEESDHGLTGTPAPGSSNVDTDSSDANEKSAETPVMDDAPRKLSRREKRLLRDAVHTVQ